MEEMGLLLVITISAVYTVIVGIKAASSKKWRRLARVGLPLTIVVLWLVASQPLQRMGFERNFSHAMSLGLIPDCERLVSVGLPCAATDLWREDQPESVRALRPFRVVVSPPVVKLLISPGIDNKTWLVVKPTCAKCESCSDRTKGSREREVRRGVYFE